MKKNMVKVALVAVVGLIAGINMLNAQKSDVLSDVAMANVEALAQVQNSGSTITGNCFASIVTVTECRVICWQCGFIWLPEERQPKSGAWYVKGKCGVCGNEDWSYYND